MLHVIIVNNALKVIVSSSLFATQFLLELCRSGTWAPCAGVCRPTLQVVLLHASSARKPVMHWEFSPPTDIVSNLFVKIEGYDFLGILKC